MQKLSSSTRIMAACCDDWLGERRDPEQAVPVQFRTYLKLSCR